ncbi:hypothetical protein [Desulfocurvus sp.]|uniref:hypothetical protein n=1 Tax=Desulfocurvus sp. TaxID=2871698 RepID=UPI0025BDABE4|nr:hypothetical protein [Desulfocurvus sp.]MCK9241264.1 hypothetical protein [Desulfocurvus sp.]
MRNLLLTCALAVALGLGGVAAWAVVRVNPGIRGCVEAGGSGLLGVPVALDEADVSLFSLDGELRGLHVGNPEGFAAPLALELGSLRLELAPESFSGPLVVVRTLEIRDPVLTCERAVGGASNLDALLSRALEAARRERLARDIRLREGREPGGWQGLVVDRLVCEGATLALGPGGGTVPLPALRLEALGRDRGPGGAAPAEIVAAVLDALVRAADQAQASAACIPPGAPSAPAAPPAASGP